MYTVLMFISMLGALLIVNTAKRVVLREKASLRIIQKDKKFFRYLGIVCVVSPLFVLLPFIYTTTAIMIWLNVVIIAFMLVVLFNPIQYIRYNHILIGFTILFIIEITFSYAC